MSHPKDGYWSLGDVKAMLGVVKGNELSWKNIVCLDYPDDVPCQFVFQVETGDFGEPSKEVKEATGGASAYNIQMKGALYTLKAVINDDATKMTLMGIAGNMEVWTWITPEKVKEMAEGRDDAAAPR